VQRVRLPAKIVTRAPVELLEVNGLSFIRIHEFRSHETRRALETTINALHAEPAAALASGQQRLVLDLRYASGGDLFEMMDAASLFLRGGLQLATVVNGDEVQQAYSALPGMQRVFRPVLLLIGQGTASASEVFVRALERYGMAFSIGSETRGKCLSQRLFRLPNGGQMLLSNRRILDPDGHYCAGHGIAPDLAVADDDKPVDTEVLIRRGLAAMTLRSGHSTR
jgi:carboxyl-terminal processing protease